MRTIYSLELFKIKRFLERRNFLHLNYDHDDNLDARKLAEKLGSSVKGSVGLLLSAKQKGIIPLLRPYLDLIEESNFRIFDKFLLNY